MKMSINEIIGIVLLIIFVIVGIASYILYTK